MCKADLSVRRAVVVWLIEGDELERRSEQLLKSVSMAAGVRRCCRSADVNIWTSMQPLQSSETRVDNGHTTIGEDHPRTCAHGWARANISYYSGTQQLSLIRIPNSRLQATNGG